MTAVSMAIRSMRALARKRAARPAMIALIVALPGAALWRMASRSFFSFDDFWQIRITLHQRLTVHFLREPLFQHFGPGVHLIFWVLVRFFPLQFGPALAIVMLFYLGSVLAFQASLDLLFGRRWATLPATFLFASSLFWVESVDWFGCGVQRTSATFFSLLTLYGYLRFAYHGRARWLVFSIIAYCGALFFFIGPILLPFYLLALRLLFLGDKSDLRIRAAFRIVWQELRFWHGYAFVSVLYLINYFHLYWYSAPRPKVVDVLDFLQLAWVRSLFPGVLGFQPVPTLSGQGLAKVLFAQAVLILVVVVSVRYRPGAWRGWAFAFGTFFVLILLSGGQRVSDFGAGIALTQRYFLDPTWLLLLGGALALLPHRQAYGTQPKPTPRRPLPPVAPLVAIVVVALMAHAALAWHSANEIFDAWPGNSNRVYFEHLTADLDTLERRGEVLNLADVAVPETMIGSWIAPYDFSSNVFAALPRPLVFDDFSQPLWVPDVTGRLHRAVFQKAAGGSVASLEQAHKLQVTGAVLHSGKLCVAAGNAAMVSLVPGTTISSPRNFVRFKARGTATVGTMTQTTLETPPWVGPTMNVTHSGISTSVLDSLVLARLSLDIHASSRFCISSIAVGTFAPAGPAVGD